MPFTISAEAHANITKALKTARLNIIPWDVLKGIVSADPKAIQPLRPRRGVELHDDQRVTVDGYRLTISFEEQPIGIIRHLSMKHKDQTMPPPTTEMHMIVQAFGFSGYPPKNGEVWTEEIKPCRHVMHVAELDEQPC